MQIISWSIQALKYYKNPPFFIFLLPIFYELNQQIHNFTYSFSSFYANTVVYIYTHNVYIWCCSESMVRVQIPWRENKNLSAQKSYSNIVGFNYLTWWVNRQDNFSLTPSFRQSYKTKCSQQFSWLTRIILSAMFICI